MYLECNSYELSTPSSIRIQTSALLLWKLRYGRCRGFAWPVVIFYSIKLFYSVILLSLILLCKLRWFYLLNVHITYRIKLLPVWIQKHFFHTKFLMTNKHDEAIISRIFLDNLKAIFAKIFRFFTILSKWTWFSTLCKAYIFTFQDNVRFTYFFKFDRFLSSFSMMNPKKIGLYINQ